MTLWVWTNFIFFPEHVTMPVCFSTSKWAWFCLSPCLYHSRYTREQESIPLYKEEHTHWTQEQHIHSRFYTLKYAMLSHFSCVRLCATPQTAAHQAPPSLGFSRQEHWSGVPLPSPMHESEKWKRSRSVVSDSPRPHGLQPTRLLCPWDFPGKSTGVGCHWECH